METIDFQTELGHMAIARSEGILYALTFGHKNKYAALRALAKTLKVANHEIQSDSVEAHEDLLAARLVDFADGQQVCFDDVAVAANHLTDFQQNVIQACRAIPLGETRTYGELASAAGRPRAARAVGSVMANNRIPLIIPCHRVVPAGAGLGGFSAPQGVAMKRRLLTLEQQASMLAVG